MNCYWSWIFILSVLSCHNAFGLDPEYQADRPDIDDLYANHIVRRSDRSPKRLGPIIGGALGGIILCLLVLVICFHLQRRRPVAHPEEGVSTPQLSGRQWFSRFGRFQRFPRAGQRTEKLEVSSTKVVTVKDLASMNEKLPSLPKHMAEGGNAPILTSPSAFPLPPSPAYMVNSANNTPFVVSFPSPLSGRRLPSANESLRSLARSERRRVQVASQQSPITNKLSPRAFQRADPETISSRRRAILPNPFRMFQRADVLPPVPAAGPLELSKPPEIMERRTREKLAREVQSKVHRDETLTGEAKLTGRVHTPAEPGRRSLDHGAAPPF